MTPRLANLKKLALEHHRLHNRNNLSHQNAAKNSTDQKLEVRKTKLLRPEPIPATEPTRNATKLIIPGKVPEPEENIRLHRDLSSFEQVGLISRLLRKLRFRGKSISLDSTGTC
jgi:hypothetical protein